jgi:hypothetical protein
LEREEILVTAVRRDESLGMGRMGRRRQIGPLGRICPISLVGVHEQTFERACCRLPELLKK